MSPLITSANYWTNQQLVLFKLVNIWHFCVQSVREYKVIVNFSSAQFQALVEATFANISSFLCWRKKCEESLFNSKGFFLLHVVYGDVLSYFTTFTFLWTKWEKRRVPSFLHFIILKLKCANEYIVVSSL